MIWVLFIVCFGSVRACDPGLEGSEWRPENSFFLRSLGWNPDPFWGYDLYGPEFDDNHGMESFDFFGGDIIPDDDLGLDKNVVTKKDKRWPEGIIPYKIDASLNSEKAAIREAMWHIQNNTCIRFVKRTSEKNYVNIYKGTGCNSKVGMVGGKQDISLGAGCYKVGKIVHEFMHAVGFYHEQMRSDRDDYIIVHWKNIQKGHEKNFDKLKPSQNLLLTSYDYDSIMHYSETAFSKDKKNGLKTMTAKKKGVVLRSPGDKKLSPLDRKRVSIMYGC